MTNQEFKDLLKEADLNKKRFSELSGVNQSTVLGWGREIEVKTGKKRLSVPVWVKSWIENYKLSKRYQMIKKALDDTTK